MIVGYLERTARRQSGIYGPGIYVLGPGDHALERVARIELARSAWEADRLPLHHTRLASPDDKGASELGFHLAA